MSNAPMSTRRFPKRFHDRLGFSMPGYRQMMEIMLTGGFSNGAQEGAADAVARLPPSPSSWVLPAARASATWVGHASVVLRVGDRTVLTDPVWSDKLPGGIRRLRKPGIPWESLPRIDALVISHNHLDHLDARTVRRLPRDTPVFVPARLGRWFRRRRFRNVTELDWWDPVESGALRMQFVPAQHWSRRGVWDTNATLWGGWVLSDADTGATVYFAGDTGYCGWFEEIAAKHPRIDLAILPVGAYEPRWFMKDLHLDPDEAGRAFDILGARRMLPIHWGTFVLTREPVLDPIRRTREAWARDGRPAGSLLDGPPGQPWTIA